MKALQLVIALPVLFGMISNLPVSPESPSGTLPSVGMTVRKFKDESRKNWQNTGPRPENTVIWYPAAARSKIAEMRYGDPSQTPFFTPYLVAQDAKLSAESAKHPVLLLSHGSTALSLELMWLGYYFAQRGYIVAAVDHHGNTIAEGVRNMVPQAFLIPGERALDLSAVLDKLLSDPEFGLHIDRGRIFAAGHSAGGSTVVALAGGRFDMAHLQAFCVSPQADNGCEPHDMIAAALARVQDLERTDPVVQAAMSRQNRSFADPRIKGVFAMAPAIGEAFTEATVSGIRIPVDIVVGRTDTVTPPATNAERLAKLIKGAKFTVLSGNAGHMVFGSLCTPLGQRTYEGCRDEAGVDRMAVHSEVAELAYAFFAAIRSF
jgi:predicted dienelactone hydrolase